MPSYADNLHDPTARDGSSQNYSTYCAGPGAVLGATARGGGGVQDDGSGDDGAIALAGNNNEGNKSSIVNHDINGDSSPDATSGCHLRTVTAHHVACDLR